MKKLNYLPIALLAIAPVTAFAHKVPYVDATCAVDEEQAAYEEIPLCTEEEKEKSSATAYCKFMGHPDLAGCVEGVTSHGMAEAAGKCVDEALAKQIRPEDALLAHKAGGSGGGDGAHWHVDYKYSKEDGWHRHAWSPAAKEKAGREYAMGIIRDAKERSATNKTTSEAATNWTVGGVFRTMFGIKTVAEVEAELNGNQGGEKRETVERGPLSQKQIDEMYDKAFQQGKDNPQLSQVNPDITCERGKPKCSTSFSPDYANEDYQPQGGSSTPQTGGSKSSGSSSGSTSSGSKGAGTTNPTPTPGKTSAEVDGIEFTPGGSFAGDPSPVTKPGEMIASYDQDALINSPVSQCLMEELKEQVSKDSNKRYDPNGPNLTPEQRRKEAQGLLRKGICDTKFYGSLYCMKHKMMKLTGKMIQDPQQPDNTDLFEQLQELGKYNFGNPADYEDKTPIDFSRLPKTPIASPDVPATKPIALPGRR